MRLERFWVPSTWEKNPIMYTRNRKILIENFENQLIYTYIFGTHTNIHSYILINLIIQTSQYGSLCAIVVGVLIMKLLVVCCKWAAMLLHRNGCVFSFKNFR